MRRDRCHDRIIICRLRYRDRDGWDARIQNGWMGCKDTERMDGMHGYRGDGWDAGIWRLALMECRVTETRMDGEGYGKWDAGIRRLRMMG